MSNLENRLCPPLAIDALNWSDDPFGRAPDCRATNILGTDQIGRDIFSRLLHGARTSLLTVGLSVVIGTLAGSLVGVLVNGWRRRGRGIAYAILGLTILPFAIFAYGYPYVPLIYGVVFETDVIDWYAIVSFASFSAVLTFAFIAVAYRHDQTCRSSWFSNVDAYETSRSFSTLFRKQILNLASWIGIAAIASAALVFLQSGTTAIQFDRIMWSLEWTNSQGGHLGLFGPLVPMVLFPIAFVTFGVWWFVRHILGRLVPTAKVAFGSVRLGWALAVIAIIVAAAAIRFGASDALPTARELTQDSAGNYQSAEAIVTQGRNEVLRCSTELSSRLSTLVTLPPEQQVVEPSQHCLDLYFEHRNAPSHRQTIDFAVQSVSQTLTLALLASIASAALWTTAARSPRVVGWTLKIFVILVALIGLTMTFGSFGWVLSTARLIYPFFYLEKGASIVKSLYVFRDFAVALGISYLTIAIAKPTFRFVKTVPKLDILVNWATFFVPSVALTSGLLMLFHHHFPTNLMLYDENLGVIANPTGEDEISRSLLRNWAWTYWLALIGYAAIVFGFFAAAIWGFMRFGAGNVDDVDVTTLNPDSPSPDADPT